MTAQSGTRFANNINMESQQEYIQVLKPLAAHHKNWISTCLAYVKGSLPVKDTRYLNQYAYIGCGSAVVLAGVALSALARWDVHLALVSICSAVVLLFAIASAFSWLSVMNAIELFALYMAAMCHDFDHPGRTNAFLKDTGDVLALLYNDRSVLENYHAAASFAVMMSNEKYNIMKTMSPADARTFRYLFIELILATDLAKHFEFIGTFEDKVMKLSDWGARAEDRLCVMVSVIKMADLNGPCKPYDLHKGWTDGIVEEFFQQGDDERRLGLPVSKFMDRQNQEVAKLQENFIRNMVAPLVRSLCDTCCLPGPALPEAAATELAEDASQIIPSIKFTNIFANSPLYQHIFTNYQTWTKEVESIKEGEDKSKKPSASTSQ